MTAAANLVALQPDPPQPRNTWAEYRTVIEAAITHTPRSLQTRIGPSELGTPCDRCLIHKLAGTPEHEHLVPWLPWVGTAVHALLEETFAEANKAWPAIRWLVESTVSVGSVGGVDITGHADLFDLHTGEVTDWKIVGATTLRNVKGNGPTLTYRRQGHLYGYGFTRRGLRVTAVRIAYLPRNSVHLGDAVIWSEPYDEQVALDTIARADTFAAWIGALGADTVLASAPPHTHEEHSCNKFSDGIQPPAGGLGHTNTQSLLNIK